MNKIGKYKFSFIYVNEPESEKALDLVYSRIFQQAFENLINKEPKNIIIKPNDNYRSV